MKLPSFVRSLGCSLTLALASCATAPSVAPSSPMPAPSVSAVTPSATAAAPVNDRLDIRSVTFLKARSPEFLIFVVNADYALASSAEGNVSLGIDFTPGNYTLLTEQRVKHGSGSVELMAECKRSERTLQGVSVSLSEYPGGMPRRTLASQTRTVALPTSP